MKYKKVLNEIAQIMEINVADLDINLSLEQYGNWDSLVVISAIASIDQEFNVLLKGSEIEKCKTLQEIFDLVEIKQQDLAVNA